MLIGIAAAILGTLYMLFICSSITDDAVNKALDKELARGEAPPRH